MIRADGKGVMHVCGRYYLEREQAKPELQDVLERLNRRGLAYKTGTICPSDVAPVIANNRALTPTPFAMQWGYRMPDGKRVINARSETLLDKPLFRDAAQGRRCLIPARHYFEWGRIDRVKYAIQPAGLELMYLAGVYRLLPEGAEFSILTREPVEELRSIHDRMPVMFAPETAMAWLSPELSLSSLLAGAVQRVEIRPVPPDPLPLLAGLEDPILS